jgi:hypothetical protein
LVATTAIEDIDPGSSSIRWARMKADTSSELEILINERVAGRIALAPLWLSTLLGEIDYRQREVAHLDDLNAALRRLIARGLIRELPGNALESQRTQRPRFGIGSSTDLLTQLVDSSCASCSGRPVSWSCPFERFSGLGQPDKKGNSRH